MSTRSRTRLSGWISWPLLLCAAGVGLVPYLPLSGGGLVAKVQAFQLWLLAIPLFILALFLLRRRWLFSVAVALLLGVGLIPNLQPNTNDVTASQSLKGLTVLSFNTLKAGADGNELADLIKQSEPDVLVLVETSEPLHQKLQALGALEHLPYRTAEVPPGGERDTVIFSKTPLKERVGELGTDTTGWYSLPVVDLETTYGPVTVAGIHIFPPLGDGAKWKHGFDAVTDWAARQDSSQVILAGDFNAVRAHPELRRLSSNFPDADGLWPSSSWPADRAFPTLIGIDHILARGMSSTTFSSHGVSGSDHLAIRATLQPTR